MTNFTNFTDSMLPTTYPSSPTTPAIAELSALADKNATASNLDLVAKNKEERLYSVRARYTPDESLGVVSGGTYGQSTEFTNRGTPSSIKLLTGSDSRLLSGITSAGLYASLSDTMEDLTSEKGFSNFLLTDIQTQFTEKVQVSEMFGDTEVVYYFGKSPVTFNLSGLLIDSVDNNWFVDFIEAYQHIFRGTQLAQNYELVQINLPNMQIIGTIMSLGYSQNAARDTDIPFSITILAKLITPIATVIPSVPLTNNAVLIDFGRAEANFSGFASLHSINNLKTTIESMTSKADSLIPADIKNSLMAAGGSFADAIGAYTNTASTLLGVRSGLFSPIYGIITNITKIVQATTGDITSIIGSFTNPIKSILRDVRSISSAAMGLVTMVENSVNAIVNEPLSVINDLRSTLISLKNTSGSISRMPETVSESINRLFRSGALSSSAPFLRSGSSGRDKRALLSSGAKYTPAKGAYL